MRILQLTPGTGNFYCGSCIRDNALVLAQRRMGHDAVMGAMYLPHLVDEKDAAGEDKEILFGGLNAYLQQKAGVFRKSPQWLDKLLNSRWLLGKLANFSGSTKASDLGDITISTLRGEEGYQAKEIDKIIAWAKEHGQFDVVALSNVLLVGLAKRLKQELDVPVVCTLQGEDSFLDSLPDSHRDEAWQALSKRVLDVDHLIAVSEYYGKLMHTRLGFPESMMTVVKNGITLDDLEPAPQPPEEPTIGYLARMIEGKGLGTLVDGFIELKQSGRTKDAKLRVAGSCVGPDVKYVDGLKKELEKAGMSDDVTWLPNISREEKLAFLHSISVLSVPATYGESFGLYIIEAMACGVPVVQPKHGAFPELIEDTGGGVLCEPDDPKSLAESLDEMLQDVERCKALGAKGRTAVEEKFSVDVMAEGVLAVYERVLSERSGGDVSGTGESNRDNASGEGEGAATASVGGAG